MTLYNSVDVVWSSRREGNEGFVLELHTDPYGSVISRIEYGPMNPRLVLPFIQGRRRVLHLIHKRVLEEEGQLELDFLSTSH